MLKIQQSWCLLLVGVTLIGGHPVPSAAAEDSTYAELARLVAQTQLLEARIKLSEAAVRLKNSQMALNPDSHTPTPSVTSAPTVSDTYQVEAVVGGTHGSQAILINKLGQRLTVAVGQELTGFGRVQEISPHLGVRIDATIIPFELDR